MTDRKAAIFFQDKRAGLLREVPDGYEFVYDQVFINDPTSQPLSVNLPLRVEPFLSKALFPFFEGLLREGWLLDITSAALNLDKSDKFGFLLHTGEDAVGAVSIRPVDEKS